jgi:hypothetical protein
MLALIPQHLELLGAKARSRMQYPSV